MLNEGYAYSKFRGNFRGPSDPMRLTIRKRRRNNSDRIGEFAKPSANEKRKTSWSGSNWAHIGSIPLDSRDLERREKEGNKCSRIETDETL